MTATAIVTPLVSLWRRLIFGSAGHISTGMVDGAGALPMTSRPGRRRPGPLMRVRILHRWARFHGRRLSDVLTARQIVHLVWTHLLIRPIEYFTIQHVRTMVGGMPHEFRPRGPHRATVVIGVGLGQVPAHAYWLARRLARSWQCRVLVLQTPPGGNVEPSGGSHAFFHRIAWLNKARIAASLQPDAEADRPIIGLGFSKGGLDLSILAKLLAEHHGILFQHIVTLSTPWQGSRLWKKSLVAGGEHFKPHNDDLRGVESVARELRAYTGVRFHFYTAFALDQIVHRSDARFRRPEADAGLPVDVLKRRWYFARPLWLQFGHTALFNGLVNVQMGLVIRDLARAHDDEAARLRRLELRERARRMAMVHAEQEARGA